MSDEEWPTRPVLVPGVRVTRRDDGSWQVGRDPRRRVVLPDLPAARSVLAAVVAGRGARPEPAAWRWARPLLERGLVVDAGDVDAAHRAAPSYAVAAAALARHGRGATDRLRRRSATVVAVDTDDAAARDAVSGLLADAGLSVTSAPTGATVRLLVATTGELAREATDPWMREALPHLVVVHCAGRLAVGPFVAPGVTACLRCCDGHDSDRDPGHGLLVEQHPPRPDDRPDPLLLGLALRLAVQDLVTFAEGDQPAMWSSVVEVDAALTLQRRALTRHPRCGCSWGDGLEPAYQSSLSSLPSIARRCVREHSSQ